MYVCMCVHIYVTTCVCSYIYSYTHMHCTFAIPFLSNFFFQEFSCTRSHRLGILLKHISLNRRLDLNRYYTSWEKRL